MDWLLKSPAKSSAHPMGRVKGLRAELAGMEPAALAARATPASLAREIDHGGGLHPCSGS